jgi:hypothetical protein
MPIFPETMGALRLVADALRVGRLLNEMFKYERQVHKKNIEHGAPRQAGNRAIYLGGIAA